MLPKLTKKRSVGFQTTEPEPAFVIARRNVLQDLKGISRIHVSIVGKGSKQCYKVEVFADSSHCRMPTNTTSTTSSAASCEIPTNQDGFRSEVPIASVDRELCDCIGLRDKVYNNMFLAHSVQYCKFCSEVLNEVVNEVDPGGVFFTLFGEDQVVRKLKKFIDDLVFRTVQNAASDSWGCCSAQTLVPETLHNFLFTETA
ncbi:hypothetical protein P3T76_000926 [Phytophthora citrophthora]|uniref:Uncharacterized protein n=1 Tax=Phytophthora citrophthora TaxID=4793 RepID=A0AAD9GYG9_9STRA|nr:hypothetical protein P3T76_000926 [Phytophthora citrophthora]